MELEWHYACFPEDPVQKIIEQMEPPCRINTKTNGMFVFKIMFLYFIALQALSHYDQFVTFHGAVH